MWHYLILKDLLRNYFPVFSFCHTDSLATKIKQNKPTKPKTNQTNKLKNQVKTAWKFVVEYNTTFRSNLGWEKFPELGI